VCIHCAARPCALTQGHSGYVDFPSFQINTPLTAHKHSIVETLPPHHLDSWTRILGDQKSFEAFSRKSYHICPSFSARTTQAGAPLFHCLSEIAESPLYSPSVTFSSSISRNTLHNEVTTVFWSNTFIVFIDILFSPNLIELPFLHASSETTGLSLPTFFHQTLHVPANIRCKSCA